jgi:putative FmdB family regulatory protein
MSPWYDYECEECKHTEEHQHGMNEELDIVCPECLKKPGENSRFKMVKLISKGIAGHVPGSKNPCKQ